MARELNLKVMFEAIDRMSPVLARIGIGLDNANKAAAAAGRSMRHFAAVGATLGGAYYGASKITEHLKAAGDLAEPLAEAQTAFEQVAGAQNVMAASAAALALTQKYGQAPRQDELEQITQGYRLYGNLKSAIDATTAATKLAVATHQPLADSFAMLATFARNAGLSVGAAADKLARFYQVAGAAAESKTDVRMLQRGLAAAQLQHVPIDRYLATVATLLKSEGTATGIGADVFMYFEPAKAKKAKKGKKGEAETVDTVTRRASAEALHAMVAHAGDLTRNLAAMHRATGALDTMTRIGLADPALVAERARISAAASQQAKGEAYLKASVPLEIFNTKFAVFIAGLETAHPLLTEIAVGTGLYGAGLIGVGAKLAGAVIALHTLRSSLDAAAASALKLAGAVGGGDAAGAAEKAAGGDAGLVAQLLKRGVRVVTVSAAAGGVAGSATIGAALAVGTAWQYGQDKLGRAIGEKIGKGIVGVYHHFEPVEVAPRDRGGTPREVHVHVHVEHSGDTHITVPPDTDPGAAAEMVKSALDSHGHEIARKVRDALDAHDRVRDRAKF